MRPETIPHGRFEGEAIESVPEHHQQWMRAMNVSVADKIEALLNRVASLKTADQLKPNRFDAAGERHAEQVAARDREAQ